MLIRVCLLCLTQILCVAVAYSDDRPDWSRELFIAPDSIDAIYVQAIGSQDGSTTDGFALSQSAAPLLPAANPLGDNARSAPIEVLRKSGDAVTTTAGHFVRQDSCLQLALESQVDTDGIPAGTLLILGRHRTKSATRFEIHLPGPSQSVSKSVLAHFGLTSDQVRAGCAGLDTAVQFKADPAPSRALTQFLPEFDRLEDEGFVPTQRRGSTGVGYTLESLLEIPENNIQAGDFLGMEIKAHRDSEFRATSSRRMNLFLKEPTWIDGLSHRSRIPKYGYVDDNGRLALYSTVTSRENSHKLSARVDREKERVWLQYRGEPVAYWTFEILSGRLQEKLLETVFVGATTRGTGEREEFHYDSVLYCRDPSVDRFVSLLERGEVVIEMRMHLKPEGSARNHGTAFRVRQNRIPQLYAVTVQCR